ncbi:hypothetical protein ACFIQF_11490 [Comamonas sp. J-3]|uniref:hypothetical protein n=1 Tax=Comamonas trifloxystrobinivorans TaxID=3350256 RepID=UPI0037276B2B
MRRARMDSDVVQLGLFCMLADHGAEEPELLASLAYLIGMGAEIARAIPVAGQNRPGLHQALIAVVDMTMDGHRWDSSWAAQLGTAAEISIDLFCSYNQLGRHFEPGARQLSQEVKAGTVKADAIAPLNFPSGKDSTKTAAVTAEIS